MCPVMYDRGKGLVADQKGEYHRVTCIVSGTESRYLPTNQNTSFRGWYSIRFL